MLSFWSALFNVMLWGFAGDVEMAGLHVNDSKQKMHEVIDYPVVYEDAKSAEYFTNDGNFFSVTLDQGKVVYMENAWGENEESLKPLFTGFEFGKTTLRNVREEFCSEGYAYKRKMGFVTAKDFIMFKCFNLNPNSSEVLVTVFRVSLKEDTNSENLEDKMTLDAVILADRAYLDKKWGKEKVFAN
jgi:hypothetical protein